MDTSMDVVAREILDVVPGIMRTIRTEMRSQRAADLSVPLFRTMLFLERHPGVSLLDLASHLGLTSPTVCKIVDGMESRGLVRRQPSQADHRKITLGLTREGQAVLEKARSKTQTRLVELLTPLSEKECKTVFQALQILQPLFLAAGDKAIQGETEI